MATTSDFNNFFFTSNLTEYVCPGFGNARCPPPQACATDPTTGATYCCDARHPTKPSMGRVCWSIGRKCANDGSTKNCGGGDNAYCCLSKTEDCTGNPGQTDNCWSTGYDILRDIERKDLNDTYSSLSSARPSQASWAFDPLKLIAATATGSQTISQTSSSSFTTPTASSTSSNSATATPPASSGSSISGGAIAGIVVGVVAVLAVGAGLGFFVARRKRRQRAAGAAAEVPGDDMYKKNDEAPAKELSSAPHPQELSTEPLVAELDGSEAGAPGVKKGTH